MRHHILSFHPALIASENRLLASQRPLNRGDRRAVGRASAVILPQICRRDLQALVREMGKPHFPSNLTRLTFDGKIGNHQLFAKLGLPAPPGAVFPGLEEAARAWEEGRPQVLALGSPLVVKGAGGGQGENVFLARDPGEIRALEGRISPHCQDGPPGVLLQKMIPTGGRDLRVVVLGRREVAYWRQAPPGEWRSNISRGGRADFASDPEGRERGRALARELADRAGIDLAGVDVLAPPEGPPLLLEINFYFGREALGGTGAFLELYLEAVRDWLSGLGLDPAWVDLER